MPRAQRNHVRPQVPWHTRAMNTVTAGDIPRPEHPRPQLRRSAWINLNGAWTCRSEPVRPGQLQPDKHRDMAAVGGFESPITVPFCPESPLSGVGDRDFIGVIWYHRVIEVPAEWAGRRVLLHFGAVFYRAEIYVDGAYAGQHVGGSVSFAVDVTRFVEPGASHHLMVAVTSDLWSGTQPSGKQSWKYRSYGCHYTRTTGIWQTVWLEAVDPRGLADVHIVADIEAGRFLDHAFVPRHRRRSALRDLGQPRRPGNRPCRTGGARRHSPCRWRSPIPSFGNRSRRCSTTWSCASRAATVPKPIACPATRGCGRPTSRATGCSSTARPAISSWCSTRASIRTASGPLRRTRRYGATSSWPWRPASTAPGCTRRCSRSDTSTGRTASAICSGASRRAGGSTIWTRGAPHRNFLAEWREIVRRDRNHPSIIAWTPFNETWDIRDPRAHQRIHEDAYAVCKSLDPTRPVNDASGYVHHVTDLYTVHSYEQDPAKLSEQLARPAGPRRLPQPSGPGRTL